MFSKTLCLKMERKEGERKLRKWKTEGNRTAQRGADGSVLCTAAFSLAPLCTVQEVYALHPIVELLWSQVHPDPCKRKTGCRYVMRSSRKGSLAKTTQTWLLYQPLKASPEKYVSGRPQPQGEFLAEYLFSPIAKS